MLRILVICKSGRLHALVLALLQSERPVEVYAMSEVDNPVVQRLVRRFKQGRTDDALGVVEFARQCNVDMVVVGPEEPLEAGVADALQDAGIGCVGPRRAAAQIEWSKSFARDLLASCLPSANPRYRIARTIDEAREALSALPRFVIKPDGLTGGKGVKVYGDHLQSIGEGLDYCRELLEETPLPVIIEEKLDGEEFTLQSFCDGTTVVHAIPIQDHKRRDNGDRGPNTGGMGSYSAPDHSLPFLKPRELQTAQLINEQICRKIAEVTGTPYKGVLYGGFIITEDGVKVIEFNSRFGDPEAMNTLALLETDFVDLCEAIVNGSLSHHHVRFKHLASVCKYVVPSSYPSGRGKPDDIVDVSGLPDESDNLRIYYASVNQHSPGKLKLTGSRAIALVGISDTIERAAGIAEAAAARIKGPVHRRTDIGTSELLQARIAHMKLVRGRRQRKPDAA